MHNSIRLSLWYKLVWTWIDSDLVFLLWNALQHHFYSIMPVSVRLLHCCSSAERVYFIHDRFRRYQLLYFHINHKHCFNESHHLPEYVHITLKRTRREEKDINGWSWRRRLNLTSVTLRLTTQLSVCAIDTPQQARSGRRIRTDVKGTLAALNMITIVKLGEIPPQMHRKFRYRPGM